MSESMYGYFFLVIGILAAALLILFGGITTKSEQGYYSLKEITESAMLDAFDKDSYENGLSIESASVDNNCIAGVPGKIRIVTERFVESFARRFAEAANINTKYKVKIYDIQECPAKVSIRVESKENYSWVKRLFRGQGSDEEFTITNDLSAILETKD